MFNTFMKPNKLNQCNGSWEMLLKLAKLVHVSMGDLFSVVPPSKHMHEEGFQSLILSFQTKCAIILCQNVVWQQNRQIHSIIGDKSGISTSKLARFCLRSGKDEYDTIFALKCTCRPMEMSFYEKLRTLKVKFKPLA